VEETVVAEGEATSETSEKQEATDGKKDESK
jgi:hypothetical protein